MENNYYKDVIKKVKDLIKLKQYNQAIDILKDELSQVYIPVDYEDAFHDLFNEAQSYIIEDEEMLPLKSKDEIRNLLNKDQNSQLIAINYLEQLNLRNYLDIISEYFLSDQSQQLKGRLLDLCAVQNIDVNIDYKLDNEIITVNPSTLELVDEMEFIDLAFDYFNNHLYKNPSLVQICQVFLVEKIYSIYPKIFLLDNVESVCKSIIYEVSEMFNDDNITIWDNLYN